MSVLMHSTIEVVDAAQVAAQHVATAASHVLTDNKNPGAGIAPQDPPGMDKFKTLVGWCLSIFGLLIFLAVAAAGVVIAWAYTHGDEVPKGVKKLGWACVGGVVVGAASSIAGVMML
jgi:hypothetical protein